MKTRRISVAYECIFFRKKNAETKSFMVKLNLTPTGPYNPQRAPFDPTSSFEAGIKVKNPNLAPPPPWPHGYAPDFKAVYHLQRV